MCFYGQTIKNKRYTATKKNGGVIPAITDWRTEYMEVGCGECMECRNEKSREWKARLLEDIKEHTNGIFITLTFSEESLRKLRKEVEGLTRWNKDNRVAKLAVRRFYERWRKRTGKSIRHWIVTELGHEGTERIHMHGIVWTDEAEWIEKTWQYGKVWRGDEIKGEMTNYVDGSTIGYIVKYITKVDHKHRGYKSCIITSAGIGECYVRKNKEYHRYRGEMTNDHYRLPDGGKIALCRYWREKLYTEKQREEMWIRKIDKGIIYIGGEEINADDTEQIEELRKYYRKENIKMGYRKEKTWEEKAFERIERHVSAKQKLQKQSVLKHNKRRQDGTGTEHTEVVYWQEEKKPPAG